MNIHGLQVSSRSLRDILRLERSLQHLAKKEEAQFDLAIACFVLVFKMQSVFSRCGFLSAAVSLEHIGISYLSANSSKCFTANGKPNYDTSINKRSHPLEGEKLIQGCILTPMHWARLHPTISPSLKIKRICYSFILSKLVYHFTMVTLQKHHYTNNPTTKIH